VGRNKIANLPQNAQLRPCWVDRFIFHSCLVAAPKRQPNTFLSKSVGWLCFQIYCPNFHDGTGNWWTGKITWGGQVREKPLHLTPYDYFEQEQAKQKAKSTASQC
jgi:hypothetical protein